MKKILLYTLLACLPGFLLAADVDTIQIYSRSMQKSIPAVVVTPDGYSSQPMQRYPVVYLLHGAGGSYSNWIKKVPAIRALADQYQAIIVCPDGASTSWYFDSPIDSGFRYETHVAREVPNHIDSAYRTINER